MKFNLDDIFGIAFWMVLGGVILWAYQVSTDNKPEPKGTANQQRKHKVAATVSAGPTTNAWTTAEGQLIELVIPYPGVGGSFLETKRCHIWRDAATNTSSMVCAPEEIDLSYTSDPPDYEDLR